MQLPPLQAVALDAVDGKTAHRLFSRIRQYERGLPKHFRLVLWKADPFGFMALEALAAAMERAKVQSVETLQISNLKLGEPDTDKRGAMRGWKNAAQPQLQATAATLARLLAAGSMRCMVLEDMEGVDMGELVIAVRSRLAQQDVTAAAAAAGAVAEAKSLRQSKTDGSGWAGLDLGRIEEGAGYLEQGAVSMVEHAAGSPARAGKLLVVWHIAGSLQGAGAHSDHESKLTQLEAQLDKLRPAGCTLQELHVVPGLRGLAPGKAVSLRKQPACAMQ